MGVSKGSQAQISTSKTIWVDSVFGNNATAAKYREDAPYSTIAGALAVANIGDLIHVRPGTYSDYNLNLINNVNFYLNNGVSIIVSAALTQGDAIFRDNGQLVNCKIYGAAILSITNTGSVVEFSVIRQNNVNSNIYVECHSMTSICSAGSEGHGVWCSGGIQRIKVKEIYCRGSCFRTDTSNTCDQTLEADLVSGHFGCVTNVFGLQNATVKKVIGDDSCLGVCTFSTATKQIFNIGEIIIGNNSESCNCGGGVSHGYIGKIVQGAGSWGVSNSGGESTVYVGEISGGERGIATNGDNARLYVSALKNYSNNAIVLERGQCTVVGGEHVGTNAIESVRMDNNSSSKKLTLKGCKIINTSATGTAIALYGLQTGNSTIIENCTLIPATGSLNSIFSSGSGQNVYCQGGPSIAWTGIGSGINIIGHALVINSGII